MESSAAANILLGENGVSVVKVVVKLNLTYATRL